MNGFHNARVKLYPRPEGFKPGNIMITNKDIFRPLTGDYSVFRDKRRQTFEAAFECYENEPRDEVDIATAEDVENAVRNYKTAHKRLYDLIQSNPQLELFVTLTFSPEEVDRTSYRQIVSKLSSWLDNRVRRDGLTYILVPEYHRDGESIHMHGLMNRNGLHIVDSGHRDHGKVIYNITDFPYGYTTAKRITHPKGGEATEAIAKYIHKYMSKAVAEFIASIEKGQEVTHRETARLKIGGRYYLSGGALLRPEFIYFDVPDYQELEAYELAFSGCSIRAKIVSPSDLTFSRLLNEAVSKCTTYPVVIMPGKEPYGEKRIRDR